MHRCRGVSGQTCYMAPTTPPTVCARRRGLAARYRGVRLGYGWSLAPCALWRFDRVVPRSLRASESRFLGFARARGTRRANSGMALEPTAGTDWCTQCGFAIVLGAGRFNLPDGRSCYDVARPRPDPVALTHGR